MEESVVMSEAPRDCWTCRHRRVVEYGPSLAAGIIEHQCAKFTQLDRFGKSTPLTCVGAYDKFCGAGDWEPTLLARIGMWLGRHGLMAYRRRG